MSLGLLASLMLLAALVLPARPVGGMHEKRAEGDDARDDEGDAKLAVALETR
jgi:hypothetical protein